MNPDSCPRPVSSDPTNSLSRLFWRYFKPSLKVVKHELSPLIPEGLYTLLILCLHARTLDPFTDTSQKRANYIAVIGSYKSLVYCLHWRYSS